MKNRDLMDQRRNNDRFCHFYPAVYELRKSLKTKAFIVEKFLDTAFPAPINMNPRFNELIGPSCSLRFLIKARSNDAVGGRPSRVATNRPPGILNGRTNCGSRTRNTTRAINSRTKLAP